MNFAYRFFKLFLLSVFLFACREQTEKSLINTQHLDNLYKEILMEGDTVAFVYIYAEHPTYEPVVAPGEGIACIDDVARAAVFYLRYYDHTKDKNQLKKAKRLIDFVLKLQANNGLFYNFIYDDYSINTTRQNSLPIPDWWAWRALWAYSEVLKYNNALSPEYLSRIKSSFYKAMQTLNNENEDGVLIASLPADQASVFLMALVAFNQYMDGDQVFDEIAALAANIISKQKGDESTFPYYAFMSWKNTWHGWGNTQAYALLKAGQLTGDQAMIDAALKEVIHFYSYVLEQNHFKQFAITDNPDEVQLEHFEQIAYAVRPMVWAALEAYKLNKDEQFARTAARLAAWLVGENVTQKAVYNPQNGRCYDGINAPDKINLNSGAESTIEALLTLLEIEQNQIAANYFKSPTRE